MTTYSLDLSKQYKAIEDIRNLWNYYHESNWENKHDQELSILNSLKEGITKEIIKTVRTWGSVILTNPDVEFVL